MPLSKDSKNRDVVAAVIDNEPQPIDSSRVIPVVSSASGEIIHYFSSATTAQCDKASEAAWRAWQGTSSHPGWKRATVTQRRNLLLKAADLFEQRKDELIEVQMKETSCAEPWALNGFTMTVNYIREIAACVSHIKGVIPPIDKPDTMAFVYKEPVGPVLIIPPWNAALVLATRAICSALAAGCTALLKASELSPLTHTLIVDIFRDAGCPAGVLNSLSSARQDAAEITETLIADERIRKVDFIGSAAVGRIIGVTCAKHLKPILMELGGKCPAIVLDDADLEKAATLCARGALLHHGQICFSTERIIVQKTVSEKFLELLVAAVKSMPGGTAITEGIAQHAYEVLQDAKEKGVQFVYGGPEMASKSAVKPALVQIEPTTRKEDLRIVDEETFGPSASIYVVEDDEEAIAIANRSAYGLNATIHTQSLERGIKVGRELEYGQVHCNSITVYTSPTGPQGGRKGSGWGRQNAEWGIEEFLVEKFITYHGKESG
ncbi:hypothetical protein LTS18_007543 [Coniosporium uncinatum]|uniref:Uncharacterized protein n=1 Tax=Coniosporium uncinatum TaxID=93489 RepID=A0ACC3D2Z8_9PEZI|nr:hypothetical protein LTS18_007543 [Coniosporium uncinatum]